MATPGITLRLRQAYIYHQCSTHYYNHFPPSLISKPKLTNPVLPILLKFRYIQSQQKRSFFNLPTNLSTNSLSTSSSSSSSTSFQTFIASKILPYPPKPLYEIISDIDSYSKFIPYCTASHVTKRVVSSPSPSLSSPPSASENKSYPTEATLYIGLTNPLPFKESFSSIVTCIPYQTVTADASSSPLFEKLQTIWEVKELSDKKGCEVSLRIEFAFRNPLYNVLVGGVAPKVAGSIVEAFERRVGEVMEGK